MTPPPAAPSPSASPSPGPITLASLRGLRQAPQLDPDQRRALLEELSRRMAGCSWFTIGVMAPDAATAVRGLRQLETSQGWHPLAGDERLSDVELRGGSGPVFLKGNQRNGGFLIRSEGGLGEGLLITGHNPDDPAAEDTWGPLPLDLFA